MHHPSVQAIGLNVAPRTLLGCMPAVGEPPAPRRPDEVRAVEATRRPAGGRH
ncbi:hypothetical protein ACVGOW_08920 [Pseudonocardia saturnea]